MRIMFSNLTDTLVLSSGSENANFPVENLTKTSLSQIYRSTGCADEYIRLDSGSSLTNVVSCVAIAGHNLSSAVSCIVHAASVASAIASAPTISVSVAYRSAIMMVYFTETTERFFQIDLADADNDDGYCELGRIYAGTFLQMDPSSIVEFDMLKTRTDRTQKSMTGQIYGDIGNSFLDIKYDFPRTSASAQADIISFIDDIGRHTPFFFTNFDTDTTLYDIIEPCYCVLAEDITFRHFAGNRFEFSLHIQEVG